MDPSISSEEVIISRHSLLGISSPHSLKIKGYIKHHLLIVLIDSGNTHNFINRSKAMVVHYFVHQNNNFQIIISNVGLMNVVVVLRMPS